MQLAIYTSVASLNHIMFYIVKELGELFAIQIGSGANKKKGSMSAILNGIYLIIYLSVHEIHTNPHDPRTFGTSSGSTGVLAPVMPDSVGRL